MELFRQGKGSKGFGDVFVKNAQVNIVKSEHAMHAFSDEEKESFVEHINGALQGDKDLAHILPIKVSGMDLFKAVSDGILLW